MDERLISQWLQAHAQPGITGFLLLLTHWHGMLGVSVMTLALAVLMHRRRERYWLALLVLSVPGCMLLNAALKQVFRRLRPQIEHPLLRLDSYSFPSGHTAVSTVFYAVLTLYLLARMADGGTGQRAAVIGAAALMVLLVAFSRVYLGVHYLSDVIVALLEGVLWLTLCLALLRGRFPNQDRSDERS